MMSKTTRIIICFFKVSKDWVKNVIHNNGYLPAPGYNPSAEVKEVIHGTSSTSPFSINWYGCSGNTGFFAHLSTTKPNGENGLYNQG